LGVEIERKFLVRSGAWRRLASGSELLVQGYLANTRLSSVRVRVAREQGWLSVKSMTRGLVRAEFDYPVPAADAREMLASLCEGPLVEKVRHRVRCGESVFEVDEFLGRNAGLVVAEIELEAPEASFERPAWLGDEVTAELRYYNFMLASQPFDSWTEPARQAASEGRRPDPGAETAP